MSVVAGMRLPVHRREPLVRVVRGRRSVPRRSGLNPPAPATRGRALLRGPGLNPTARATRGWPFRARGSGPNLPIPVRSTTGSVSIEAVLLVPLFLMVVFVILQASLWAYASSVAQAAAQDAVRTATAMNGGVEEGLADGMRILTTRSAGTDWTVVESAAPNGLRITVEGQALSLVPGVSFRVEESASLPWETS